MEEKRKPTRWGLWLVVTLVVLVAYPLSCGPVLYLIAMGYLPRQSFGPYRPLVFVANHSPPPLNYVLLYSLRVCKDQLRGEMAHFP